MLITLLPSTRVWNGIVTIPIELELVDIHRFRYTNCALLVRYRAGKTKFRCRI